MTDFSLIILHNEYPLKSATAGKTRATLKVDIPTRNGDRTMIHFLKTLPGGDEFTCSIRIHFMMTVLTIMFTSSVFVNVRAYVNDDMFLT